VFQHIVFAVKFLLAAFIPDVPADIILAIRRVRVLYDLGGGVLSGGRIVPPIVFNTSRHGDTGMFNVQSNSLVYSTGGRYF